MYQTFEHTADLGLRVTAGDLNLLFAEAGRGLFSIIVENLDAVRPAQLRGFKIPGTNREYLLFDWLNELLFISAGERMLLVEFDVQVSESGLTATARGEPIDLARHHLAREVKAITYHQLKVEQRPGGWIAEVLVDI